MRFISLFRQKHNQATGRNYFYVISYLRQIHSLEYIHCFCWNYDIKEVHNFLQFAKTGTFVNFYFHFFTFLRFCFCFSFLMGFLKNVQFQSCEKGKTYIIVKISRSFIYLPCPLKKRVLSIKQFFMTSMNMKYWWQYWVDE